MADRREEDWAEEWMVRWDSRESIRRQSARSVDWLAVGGAEVGSEDG